LYFAILSDGRIIAGDIGKLRFDGFLAGIQTSRKLKMMSKKSKKYLKLDMSKRSPKLSVCEVLRQIYKIAETIGSDDIKNKAVLATGMAKKMNNKLVEYKHSKEIQYQPNVWHDNPEYVKTDPLIDKLITFVATEMTHKVTATHNHVITLRTGEGTCGKTAIVLHMLFRTFDIKSRIMAVGGAHVICEFLYKGKWRLADCNLFKGPLLNTSKGYLTYRDVCRVYYKHDDLMRNMKTPSIEGIGKALRIFASPMRYPLHYDVKSRKPFSYALFVFHLFKSLPFGLINFVRQYAKK